METLLVTGLENLESKRNTKVFVPDAQFKGLEKHPVHKRMSEPTKCRLKRTGTQTGKTRPRAVTACEQEGHITLL